MLRELSDGVHETSKFKKLKLAIKRLKKSSNESKTLDIRKKRGSSSLGQTNITPRYVAGGGDSDPSLKRKRIGYAVQRFNDKERRRSHSDRDSKETGKWNDDKDSSFVKDEPPQIMGKFRKSERTMWAPNKKKNSVSLKTEKPYSDSRGSGRSETEGNRKSKVSMVDRKKYGAEVEDSGHNFARKSFAESNSDRTNKLNNLGQSKRSSSGVSIIKPWKKSFNEKKKTMGDELQSTADDQPRKRKRIRLDPHDTSNKRLDDSIITNETVEEKKENHNHEKDDDSLSMNAQFRAIRPSPSVLSFVEDNLLGRRRLIELRRAGYNIELPAPLDNIPSTNSERERIGENVFRNKLTFFAAAKVSSSFPPPELPEIAFAGRSNVGKSSLLNSLTRQWGVVRTSDKPGLTQTINFFNLGPKVCLVDLPGYGFAYAKDEVKESWEELVKEYVSTRVGLRQVCLLIDTKWGMKPRDHELIDLMERSQTKYQVVLTKTDTVFPIDVARRAMQVEETLKANRSIVQPVMMVSSKSGAGIQSLRTVLAKIARFAKL